MASKDPWICLAKSIVVQAMKDYAYALNVMEEEKKEFGYCEKHPFVGEIEQWIRQKDGSFELVSMAFDKSPDLLQRMLLDKIYALRTNQQSLYHYSRGEIPHSGHRSDSK